MKELVAWVVLEEPTTFRRQYEVAAWWTEIEVPAGRYPLWKRGRNFSCEMPGRIVASYTPALWGGVPFGKDPQGKEHRDVGRKTTYSLWWFDEWYFSNTLRAQEKGWSRTWRIEMMPYWHQYETPFWLCHREKKDYFVEPSGRMVYYGYQVENVRGRWYNSTKVRRVKALPPAR